MIILLGMNAGRMAGRGRAHLPHSESDTFGEQQLRMNLCDIASQSFPKAVRGNFQGALHAGERRSTFCRNLHCSELAI